MHDHEAFQKKIPFPLIPTNIPGAFTSPAPAEEIDFEGGNPATLIKNGILWRRPEKGDHPGMISAWKQVFSRRWHTKDRIVPHLEPQPGKTHVLRGIKKTDAGYTSNSWAGGVILGQWGTALGTWVIPTASKPSEAQGKEGGWNSASWVGIDGFNVSGVIVSNDVLQAGIEQRVNSQGTPSYVAWYEWFAPAQQGSPPYIYQTNITNFSVSPGNSISCSVQYISNKTAGYLYLANNTTGQHFSITLAPPPGATFSGNCMEWIMEAPDGGYPTSALPRFSPVNFTSAFGCSSDGKTVGNPQNGNLVNIANGSKTLTSVSLASDAVTIDFLG